MAKLFLKLGLMMIVALAGASVAYATVSCTSTTLALGGTQTCTGTAGDLAAQLVFALNGAGTQLDITLINSGLADVTVPGDVLTAVFFDLNTSLSGGSAIVPSGQLLFYTPSGICGSTGTQTTTLSADCDVGGEWAKKTGQDPYGTGAFDYGFSSAGFTAPTSFGAGDRFNSTTLTAPDAPDGLDWGITSAGDDVTTGNTGVTGNPLIKNRVRFTFTGLSISSSLTIGDIAFQYGTSLAPGEPCIGCTFEVPEPPSYRASLALLGGLLVFAYRLIERKRAASSQ